MKKTAQNTMIALILQASCQFNSQNYLIEQWPNHQKVNSFNLLRTKNEIFMHDF